MEQPTCKVSVACTAFNHGAYIRDALEGFVSQKTDFPFEVLINDDASTDDTAAVIREYAEKIWHIKPVHVDLASSHGFEQSASELSIQ